MSMLLDENLISTREASRLSGYHSDYLGRLCREGKVAASRVGRAWIVDRISLEAFMREQETAKKDNAVLLARTREQEYREAQAAATQKAPMSAVTSAPKAATAPVQVKTDTTPSAPI